MSGKEISPIHKINENLTKKPVPNTLEDQKIIKSKEIFTEENQGNGKNLEKNNRANEEELIKNKVFEIDLCKFIEYHIEPDYDTYPTTVSKFWIPMEKMKEIYPYNVSFVKNVELLERKHFFSSWKKSRGDGNCYFRAVIYKYFDNIHKVYSPISKLEDFKAILEYHTVPLPGYSAYANAKAYILNYLDHAIGLKSQGNFIKTYTNFVELMQNEEFDQNLVMVSRLLTCSNLYLLKDTDDYFPYLIDGYEGTLQEILLMGNEGGGLALMVLPVTLQIQVYQYMYLESKIVLQKFPDSVPDNIDKIFIIRRSGHYDILYHNQEREFDMLDIENGKYYFYSEPEFYLNMLD